MASNARDERSAYGLVTWHRRSWVSFRSASHSADSFLGWDQLGHLLPTSTMAESPRRSPRRACLSSGGFHGHDRHKRTRACPSATQAAQVLRGSDRASTSRGPCWRALS